MFKAGHISPLWADVAQRRPSVTRRLPRPFPSTSERRLQAVNHSRKSGYNNRMNGLTLVPDFKRFFAESWLTLPTLAGIQTALPRSQQHRTLERGTPPPA